MHVRSPSRKHVCLLLCTFSHTATVMFTFATCFYTRLQFNTVIIGTLIMNLSGSAYFVFDLLDGRHKKQQQHVSEKIKAL